ncbi:LRR domain containing protein [Parasponia andersonii]|uniref:LRR domain containing protein n=1 Tax=Parasponia andersonii TaxID=3476 RepID=A0A2P5B2X3_PARAD|nr:LRR domain containing protein [Parasponia andersonii]
MSNNKTSLTPASTTATPPPSVSPQTLIELISKLKDIVSQAKTSIKEIEKARRKDGGSGSLDGKKEGGGDDGGGDDTRKREEDGGGGDDTRKEMDGSEAKAEADSDRKKVSKWDHIKFLIATKMIGTAKKEKPGSKEDSVTKGSRRSGSVGEGSSESVRGGDSLHNKRPLDQIDKLVSNLDQIKTSLKELKHYEEDFQKKIQAHSERINDLLETIQKVLPSQEVDTSVTDSTVGNMLWEINKEMRKLKHRIPSSSKIRGSAADHHDEFRKTEGSGTETAVDGLLSLFVSKSFSRSFFRCEIEETYNGLKAEEKECLLCFAVFSENEELKKRMLTYWWEGEGFLGAELADRRNKTIEDAAGEILNTFVAKGLIEPAYKKRRRQVAKSYKMQPVVRSVIVQLAASAKFFSIDDGGNLNLEAKSLQCKRTCLVKSDKKPGASPTPLAMAEKDPSSSNSKRLENANTATSKSDKKPMSPTPPVDLKRREITNAATSSKNLPPPQSPQESYLETIFNVNEPFPDLRLKWLARDKGIGKEKGLDAEEWLSKMKALKVLYLGTWRASGKHHIEVDSNEFLKGLKSMSSLRLLSLQGISRINELTDSIKGLINLKILDLRACHNLEELPKEISYLKNLTHLDVSDCYMIDHMPKGLSYLTKLQVLKGFVVGDHKNRSGKFCTLDNLVWMTKLRKLCIVISKKDFPSENDLKILGKFGELKKLTLSWGADAQSGTSTSSTSTTTASNAASNEHPSSTTDRKNFSAKSATKNLKHMKTGISGNNGHTDQPNVFNNLEKLDLQCYPEESTPNWLRPGNLPSLKKLFIRGGKFGGDLGHSSNGSLIRWESVDTLRLKFLAGLKMDWEQMQELFPKLSYLEKVDCPSISLCPCDEDGVWVKYNERSDEAERSDEKKSQQFK